MKILVPLLMMVIISGISLIGINQAFALFCFSVGSGTWDDPNTWDGCEGGVPDDTGDTANIGGTSLGEVVQLNNDFVIGPLEVAEGGTLSINAKLTSQSLFVGEQISNLFINCNGQLIITTNEGGSNSGLLTNHGLLQTLPQVDFTNTGTYQSSGTDIFGGTFSGNNIVPIPSICFTCDSNPQCGPPNTNICDNNCQFIISGGDTVEGATDIEPLCGLIKIDSPSDFEEANDTPIIFDGPVVNNQVSDEESAFFANTGGGPGQVDITDVEDWVDFDLDFVFDGCNTRFNWFSGSDYADMSSVCGPKGDDQTYIEVLPAQTEEPSVSVERFHKVRPTIDEGDFMTVNPITTTQILELTIDCDPPALCGEGEEEVNGQCVNDD